LYVTLVAPVEVGLDDVLSQIKSSGIAATDLSSVYTRYGSVSESGGYSQWIFTPNIAIDNLKTVLAALKQLAASIGEIGGSPALNYQVTGLAATDAFRAAQFCPLPALLSDAWRQAETMAQAAGMHAGPIVAMSDGPILESVAPGALPANAFRFDPLLRSAQSPPCSLAVQFKLAP